MLQATPATVIPGGGGDFNCVLAKADVTGHFNFSRALNTLVNDMIWSTCGHRPWIAASTLITRGKGQRDWIEHVSRHFSGWNCGAETTVTVFTDHLAVILRLALNVTTARCGRNYWKMNATLARSRRSGNTTAALEGMETTAQLLPSHSNVVGEGREEPNTQNPHQ
jgi:hypothetical protein